MGDCTRHRVMMRSTQRRSPNISTCSFTVVAVAVLAICIAAVLPQASGAVPPPHRTRDSIPIPWPTAEGPDEDATDHYFHGLDRRLGSAYLHVPSDAASHPAGSGRQGTSRKWNKALSDIRTRSTRVRAMVDGASAGLETVAETVRSTNIPLTCGGVTFSKDGRNFLVRSDNEAGSHSGAGLIDCGYALYFQSSGIAGLSDGVFANMSTLQHL